MKFSLFGIFKSRKNRTSKRTETNEYDKTRCRILSSLAESIYKSHEALTKDEWENTHHE